MEGQTLRVFFKMPRVFFQVFKMPLGQGIVKAMLHTIFCVDEFQYRPIRIQLCHKYIKIRNGCGVLELSALFSFFGIRFRRIIYAWTKRIFRSNLVFFVTTSLGVEMHAFFRYHLTWRMKACFFSLPFDVTRERALICSQSAYNFYFTYDTP